MQAIHAPFIPQSGTTHVCGNLVLGGGERLRVFDLLRPRQGDVQGFRLRKVWEQRGAGEVTGLKGVRLVGSHADKLVVGWGAKHTPFSPTARSMGKIPRALLVSVWFPGTGQRALGSRERKPVTDPLGFPFHQLSILEWSGGEVSTVSLHTFERAPQVLYANPEDVVPLLRTDPQSKMIVQLLPEDSLAIIPLVQDMEELEGFDSTSARDVPYMPSFVLSLLELSPLLRNVKDLAFLPGFNNPTLAILFCPLPTATGRTAAPRDTFQIEIRTLDPLGQTYPLISSTVNLPHDSQYIVPCPQSIGGILLVTATAVFHIDQSGKYVCTSSNGWFKFVSNITPTRRREECLLELDGSHVVWADEGNFLMVLKDGTVHQARLQVEGRSVVGIDFLSPSGPLPVSTSSIGSNIGLQLGLEQPSSVCEIALPASEDGQARSAFFAASAVGDSCLVAVDMVPEEMPDGDVTGANAEPKHEEMDVDLDDDLYGDSIIRSELTRAERAPMQAHLSITAKVCGIGYISDMTFGVTPEKARENVPGVSTVCGSYEYYADALHTWCPPEQNLSTTREPEIAILQGAGKGASTIDLIRPQLRMAKKRKYDELVGSANVWAVQVDIDLGSTMDQLQETVTRLFQVQTGDEGSLGSTYLWAVDPVSGELQEVLTTYEDETVAVGSCRNGSCIARVSSRTISLLDADGGIIAEHHLEKATEDTDESDLIVQADICSQMILLRRKSGRVLVLHISSGQDSIVFEAVEVEQDRGRPFTSAQFIFDDSGIFRTFEASAGSQLASPEVGQNGRTAPRTTLVPSARTSDSYLLALANVAGDFEIRAMPSLELVFKSSGLNNANQALIDDGLEDKSGSNHMDTSDGAGSPKEEDDPIRIEQICITSIGDKDNVRPYLMVLYSTDMLLVYEAQPRFTLESEEKITRKSLAVRFRKVMTKILGRRKLPRLIQPVSLSGCHFACLTGSNPVFLFEDELEGLICSNWAEPINSVTTLTLDQKLSLLLNSSEATLLQHEPREGPDTARCCRKRLERTYTHLTYDPRSSYYVGASAISVPYQLYNDECESVPGPEVPNLTPALIERSTLELFDPRSWTVVDGYEFDENEVVLCIENAVLEATSSAAGVKRYLVVGTSVNRGEDMSSKGNTYVFEIIEVIGAAECSGDWELRLICMEEGKGPVSALANVGQYLVQAMGQKVYVKALDKEDHLVPVAFLDVPPYITSIKVFKNLILIGDIVKGVWLAVFQEAPFRLNVIAKDFYDVSVVTVDFLSSESMITFSTVDDQGDLRLLEFNPEQSASNEVAKLVRRTEYHIGQPVTKSLMVARRKTAEDRIAPQTQIIYADSLGGVSTLIPLKAARFKRLQLLQGQVTRSVQHLAGLNPKAYRHVPNRQQARALNKGVLDGFLLQTFIDLPFDKQTELVDPIGTNRETIINDLVDLSFTW
ncbi:hypothetical protein QFC19_000714 [Naganishia cerealis]|uniref:Uncharacterized protein n=1 Tax=Naganishia cerealis TaxID=610337 RepID=A0ACC2WLU3_9TREE|nr:hypothetical protein QFC19_000714 [Naganishia cerealis]